jgi:hypothetical protein
MPRPARTVAVLTLPLLLTACSGGGGAQSSPQSLTAAVYDDVHAGEFGKACALVLPAAMARFTAAGTDCQSFFAKQYDPGKRAGLADVKVDAKAVQVNGDTAVVPESAVTFGGRPSSDGDTKLALRDGKWFVAG